MAGTFALTEIRLQSSESTDVVNITALTTGELIVKKNSVQNILSLGRNADGFGELSANVLTFTSANIVGNLSVVGDISGPLFNVKNDVHVLHDTSVGGTVSIGSFNAENIVLADGLIISGGGSIFANDGADIDGSLSALGNTLVLGGVSIAGTLQAVGDVAIGSSASDGLSVAGSMTVETGVLTVEGADVDGSLSVSVDTAVGGGLSVAFASTFDGHVSVAQSATVGGTISVGSGDTTIGGTMSVASAAYLVGTIDIGGSLSLGGALSVGSGTLSIGSGGLSTGGAAVTIAGSLDASGDTVVASDAAVNGSISLGADLLVAGQTTLTGTLTAADVSVSGFLSSGSGDFAITGTLSVAQTMNVDAGLTVLGDVRTAGAVAAYEADFGSAMSVGTTSTFTSSISIAGDTTVGGVLSIGAVATSFGDLSVAGSATMTGNVQVVGGSSAVLAADVVVGGALAMTSGSATATVHGAAFITGSNDLSVGTSGGASIVRGSVTVEGDMTVQGSTTKIASSDLNVIDDIIQLGLYSDPALDEIGFLFGSNATTAFKHHGSHFGTYFGGAASLGEFRSGKLAAGTALSLDAAAPVTGYFSTTDALKAPLGTSAQRPPVPQNGQIRYNTNINTMEAYANSAWLPLGGTRTPDGTTRIDAFADSLDFVVESVEVCTMFENCVEVKAPVLSVSTLHVDLVNMLSSGAYPTDVASFTFNNDAEVSGDMKVTGSMFVTDVIFTGSGTPLDGQKLSTILAFDGTPTVGSLKTVTSAGIFDAIALKQDVVTIDSALAVGSPNLITSGAVHYRATQGAPLNTVPIEAVASIALSLTPVQIKLSWSAAKLNSRDYQLLVEPRTHTSPPRWKVAKSNTSAVVTFYLEDGTPATSYPGLDVQLTLVKDAAVKFQKVVRVDTSGSAFYLKGETSQSWRPYDPAAPDPLATGVLAVESAAGWTDVGLFANDAAVKGVDFSSTAQSAFGTIGESAFDGCDFSVLANVTLPASGPAGTGFDVRARAFANITAPGDSAVFTVTRGANFDGDEACYASEFAKVVFEEGFDPESLDTTSHLFSAMPKLAVVDFASSVASFASGRAHFEADAKLRTAILRSPSVALWPTDSFTSTPLAKWSDAQTDDLYLGYRGTPGSWEPGIYAAKDVAAPAGRYAFYHSSPTASSVADLPRYDLYDATGQQGTIVVGATATEIGTYAFAAHAATRIILLPYASALTTIGAGALSATAAMTAMSSLRLPPTVTSLHGLALASSAIRGAAHLPSAVATTAVLDACAFDTIAFDDAAATPAGTTSTAPFLARNGANMRVLYLGNNITTLGAGIAYGCASLSRMQISQPFTVSMAAEAFDLSSFAGTGIATSVGPHAAGLYIKTGAATLAHVDGSEFAYCHVAPNTTTVNDYTAAGVSNTAGYLVVGHGVSTVASCAGHASLLAVDFSLATAPNLTLAPNCFDGCTALADLVFPVHAVITLSEACFRLTACQPDLYVPTSVSMPASATDAFSGTTAVVRATFAASAETATSEELPARTFSGCTALEVADLGNRFAVIGDDAFLGCTALHTVIFTRAVTLAASSPFASTPFAAHLVGGQAYAAGVYSTPGDGTTLQVSPLPAAGVAETRLTYTPIYQRVGGTPGGSSITTLVAPLAGAGNTIGTGDKYLVAGWINLAHGSDICVLAGDELSRSMLNSARLFVDATNGEDLRYEVRQSGAVTGTASWAGWKTAILGASSSTHRNTFFFVGVAHDTATSEVTIFSRAQHGSMKLVTRTGISIAADKKYSLLAGSHDVLTAAADAAAGYANLSMYISSTTPFHPGDVELVAGKTVALASATDPRPEQRVAGPRDAIVLVGPGEAGTPNVNRLVLKTAALPPAVTIGAWVWVSGTSVAAEGPILTICDELSTGDYLSLRRHAEAFKLTAAGVDVAQVASTSVNQWVFIALAAGAAKTTLYVKPSGGALASAEHAAPIAYAGAACAVRMLVGEDATAARLPASLAHVTMWSSELSSAQIDTYAGLEVQQAASHLVLPEYVIGCSQNAGGVAYGT